MYHTIQFWEIIAICLYPEHLVIPDILTYD